MHPSPSHEPSAGAISLPGVLRAHTDEIIELWAAESTKIPFTKAADFSIPLEARIDRMRAYLDAVLERMGDPGSKRAHEILRSTIRTEHLRSLNLSSVIRNQHILRGILYGVAERNLPELARDSSRTAIEAMIDRSIEEIVILLEEFAETQGVLMRCLTCAPTERAELDHVIARFCRNAMDYFDADFVAVFRFSEGTRELVVTACAAKGVSLSKDRRIMLDTFPVAAEAIGLRKVRTCLDAAREGGSKKKSLGQFSYEHCIAVPMEIGDRVVGLLFLADNSRSTAYTMDEVGMAQELGDYVQRVIENSEMFEVLTIRARAQKALIDTAVTLQREIESEEIYRVVGNRIIELIPSNELAFYMFDWNRHVGNPVYAFGPYASEVMEDHNFPMDVGICGHVARTKRAEIVQDTEADPRGDYIPGTPTTHSRMLAVPLVGRKDVLGVIELLKYPPDNFSNEDLEIATLFANHAAVAIENARLLKEVLGARDQVELHIDLLSHDIANLTTPVSAYLETIGRSPGLDDGVRDKVDRSLAQVESIMRLVQMVRIMGRLRENAARPFTRTDLRAAVASAAAGVKGLRGMKPVDIEVTLPEGRLEVLADELLVEIFNNLFLTALRSDRQDRPRLVVTAESRREGRRDMWWVRVSQPNRVIPDHLKADVLRMVKAAKSELGGGFGIGLATSRGIAERYLGQMWVTDMVRGDPSKGCVYNITLPKA